MIWYLAGLGWMLHILFWGIGLALWTLPRRWRPFWPFCAPVAGLGLQSTVVWWAAHTPLRGAGTYAIISLLIPAALLGTAAWRDGPRSFCRTLGRVGRWWAVALLMILILALATAPFAARSRALTSPALTSCDAADYAGGAYLLRDFAGSDRTGYLGVPEGLRTLSVDNYFDFWLRLNHFTPSALIALHAAATGWQPYQLTSLLGAVLLALSLPGVFWLARSAFRFGPAPSLAVTAVYGCSPIVGYAVAQVALGQLLAAPAVALLLWAGWQAWRGSGKRRALAPYAGTLVLGEGLLLCSYNFFILFAFVPMVAFAGAQCRWRRAGRWAALLGLTLLGAALLFPERVVYLAERFYLFNKTAFGWPMPGFFPAGWFGDFADVKLQADGAALALIFAGACLATFLWAWAVHAARRSRRGGLALAWTLPIFAGYYLLLWKDARNHDNASYDAFKLFAVFYPGTLISLCLWLQPPAGTRQIARVGVALLWLIALGVNVGGSLRYRAAMSQTALWVPRGLVELEAVDAMPEVGSLNMMLENNWDVLWACAFLLHKPQYFPYTAYEAQHSSPLQGEWDLRDRYLEIVPGEARDSRAINGQYGLVNRRAPDFAEATWGAGWYPLERERRQTWRWSGGSPEVILNNPQATPLRGTLEFSARSLTPRAVGLEAGSRQLWRGELGHIRSTVGNLAVELPPGKTTLRFLAEGPPAVTARDGRALTLALYQLQIRLEHDPAH